MNKKHDEIERKCNSCGDIFMIKESRLKYRAGKYCSAKCQAKGMRRRIHVECGTCKKVFETRKSSPAKFCSRKCVVLPREANEERFLRFVIKHKDPDVCWSWSGSTNEMGYGQIRDSNLGRNIIASRMSYFLFVGEIPKNLCVLHKCDNPSCTNPSHLFLGTRTDNNNDKQNKGRTPKGEKHPGAKLCKKDVLCIRKLHSNGARVSDLAVKFSVSRSTIGDVVHNRTWRHV